MIPIPPLTALIETRKARLLNGCRIEQITAQSQLALPQRLQGGDMLQLANPHHASGQHNLRKAFTPAKR